MVSRAADWLRQALRDLEHAKKSLEMGYYEWACFAAHQSAEKAVKALYQALGIEAWGHSVSKMLSALPEGFSPNAELIEKAKRLDRDYISSRYPNSYSEGAPLDYYTKSDAEKAVEYASEVVEFVRNKVVQTRS